MSDFKLTPQASAAIIAHARAEYPKEACGLLIGASYKPCVNAADDPEKDFVIPAAMMEKALLSGKLKAVIHSHPNGPNYPSQQDMESQIATAVPWVIVPLDEEREYPFVIWGDQLSIKPLVGREFIHGVADCYTLIRDAYRLGREALAKQDIDWPFPAHEIPDFPRDDNWWAKEGAEAHSDLYTDNFAHAGFYPISRDEARPGDVFLCKLKSDRLNHGGVVIGGGLIIHHLATRLSRREPSGIWGRSADLWLRCKNVEYPEDAA